jgi:nucleotide-binding universal stress UspA family protein
LIGVTEVIPGLPAAARASAPAPGAPHGAGRASDLEGLLNEIAAGLPPELRAQPVHEKGDPAERLLERAEQGVDLLVLGSRGHGPVMRALLGSVSAKVIRRATCPVLIVPRQGGRGKAP